MAHDPWSPTRYARFRRERRQPFRDLLALVRPAARMRVVDLGCGSGEITRLLHDHLGARETLGIDSSVNMLERATPFVAQGLRFEYGDIASFAANAAWDLVFSNAVLHWLPDHPNLLARLIAAVRPRGQLALHFPSNFEHPSHRLAVETARERPFAELLGGWERDVSVLPPERYAERLAELGCREQTVRLQIYGHHLRDVDDVVEWTRGTLLTDYERRLPADAYAAFVERYRDRLRAALGTASPYFYTYRRLLVWARRPASGSS